MNSPIRLGIQQRVLPLYRTAFFELLGAQEKLSLGMFFGKARVEEAIHESEHINGVKTILGSNIHLFRGALYLCWQRGLLRWLKSWSPDVLILEANPRYPNTPNAMRWMKKAGKNLIGWGLGAPEVNQTNLSARILAHRRRQLMMQFDAVICYSQQGAQEYEMLGTPREKIFVAPNAVAPRPAHEMPERPEPAETEPATILYVGRLQARKRLDLLLQACAALPETHQPRLNIVGDGPAMNSLIAQANKIFPAASFPGAIHGSDLDRWFEEADLFVLPGTGGLAIQQAMSFALPIIAAEADGTQNDLVTPKNGWQVIPGDLNNLTSSLQSALDNIPALRKMGEESYRIVSEEINLENMVQVFEKAIHFVMEK